MLGTKDLLAGYPWSSLVWYLTARKHRPAWIRVDRLLGEHGLQKDTPEASEEFQRRMEARRMEGEDEQTLGNLRRGWCFGSSEFKQQLLEEYGDSQSEHQTGELRWDSSQSRAERIIAQGLRRLGWKQSELATRRKGDEAKLAMAARLRKETTLTMKEIAARLSMGTTKSATTTLHRWMRTKSATARAG